MSLGRRGSSQWGDRLDKGRYIMDGSLTKTLKIFNTPSWKTLLLATVHCKEWWQSRYIEQDISIIHDIMAMH